MNSVAFFILEQKGMKYNYLFWLFFLSFCACTTNDVNEKKIEVQGGEGIELMVLGVAQDAGYPQTACVKDCCRELLAKGEKGALVTCLGLIDHTAKTKFLFEASPDLPVQLANLNKRAKQDSELCDGIFISHAHIGHYTGLMYLGRESVGAKDVPVYSMPRMASFLRSNGPWSQLVSLSNIELRTLKSDSVLVLGKSLRVEPIEVPHRGEYSETVGFKIYGPYQSALFIPDIDKWSKWNLDITKEVEKVDLAFLDATFFQNGEIPGRDMSEIPHPFVEETVALFSKMPFEIRQKIYFIHLNHTNPLLRGGDALNEIQEKGFNLAKEDMIFQL